MKLADIAQSFSVQTESTSTYAYLANPNVASVSTFLTSVYANLFNRAPDAAGLAYWTGEINAGRSNVGNAIINIISGAVDTPASGSTAATLDASTLANKMAAGLSWAQTMSNIAGAVYGVNEAASAKSIVASVTSDAATVTAAATSTASFFANGGAAPGQSFTLTTGVDTGAAFTGTSGNDTFNATTSTGAMGLTTLDNIDGGAGVDTLAFNFIGNLNTTVGATTVSNFEKVVANASGTVTSDTTGWTGITNLTAASVGGATLTASATTAVVAGDTALAGGAIAINGGNGVSVTAAGATTGTVNIGATAAAKGAVVVTEAVTIAPAAAAGTITINGGSTVSVTETAVATSAVTGANATGSAVTLTGTADTTSVTVKEAAAVGVKEVFEVKYVADGVGGKTLNFDGVTTTTAAGAQTAAQVAAAVVAAGATTNFNVAVKSGATDTVIYTARVAGSVADVADVKGVGTYAGAPTIAVTTQGKANIVGGNVSVTDLNSASLTAAGTITSVSFENFGAATANSNALATVTLAGTGTSYTQTTGALTTAILTTETLNLNGVTTTGTVDLSSVPKTVNIVSSTGTNTLNALSASGATAVNISGDKALVLTGDTFASTAVITSTSSGAVTLGTALAVGQQYTGGADVDTITLLASGTKAISTGDGNDVVTYAGAFATGGSLDTGAGTDTIKMTAALGVTATTDNTFMTKVTNFEVIEITDVTASAAGLNMAYAGAANAVTLDLGTSGGAYAITNAGAGFTLTQKAADATALSIALASDSGTNDTVNLAFIANDGFTNVGATTVSNVENLVITTKDADAVAQTAKFTMAIVDTAAKSITLSGDTGVDLTQASTALTNVDASGLTGTGTTGGFTFTSGALAADSTIKGSAAGTNTIDFSASVGVVTYTGGSGVDTINFVSATTKAHILNLGDGANVVNGSSANGNNTITIGSGADTITVGNGNNVISAGDGANTITVGTGANTITAGTGVQTITLGGGSNSVTIAVDTGDADIVTIGAPATANNYSTITGLTVGDKLDFADKGTEVWRGGSVALAKVSLDPSTALFADYVAASTAGDGSANGVFAWFNYGGHTYVVEDRSAGAAFVPGTDIIVKLTGTVDLAATGHLAVLGDHVITLA